MMDTQHCTFGGCLSSHEAFYFDAAGNFAVEKDLQYLVEATAGEKEEIYRLAPHLKQTGKT